MIKRYNRGSIAVLRTLDQYVIARI
jgi:hypothetical protein